MGFKFCPDCGFKLEGEYRFCPECGYRLVAAAAKEPEKKIIPEQKIPVVSANKRYQAIYNEWDLRAAEKTTYKDFKIYDKKKVNLDKNTAKRIENELFEKFNGYFREYSEFGPGRGITFETNVSPQYFGANPKCKPVHFLFRKMGKDVLAVQILTYSNYKHMAITSVSEVCAKKMKYLRFFVGEPNEEHYVVRRVLEELGVIRRAY